MSDLPKLPSTDESAANFAQRMTLIMEKVDVLAGARGDAALLDRAVTFKDLVDLGLVPQVVAQQQARAVRR